METNIAINDLIKEYKEKEDMHTLEFILIKMEPLIRKYAYKAFFLDFEDGKQEMSLAIIEAVQKIQYYDEENRCLAYIKNSVVHRFIALYKKEEKHNKWSELDENIIGDECISDIEFNIDIERLISEKGDVKRMIIESILYREMSDSEIAMRLNISRQYVNRVKKQIIREIYND